MRVVDGDEAVLTHAAHARDRLRAPGHRLVHDRDTRDALPFELDGVAHTARTARTSAAAPRDGNSDLGDESLPIHRLGWHRHTGLHDGHHVTDRCTLPQLPRERVEERFALAEPVHDDADDGVVERRWPRLHDAFGPA